MKDHNNEKHSRISIKTFDEKSGFHVYHVAKLFYPESEIIILSDSVSDSESSQAEFVISRDENGLTVTDEDIVILTPGFDKESVKRLVFEYLTKKTGKIIPWGTLIGVRPTKIASALLDKGKSPDEIRNVYRNDYLVTENKIQLALNVAEKENEILSHGIKDECGIYIDMPFCPSKCFYCSFLSQPSSNKAVMDEYLKTLENDIVLTGEKVKELGLKPRYIYFGGGTPTAPGDEDFEHVMKLISEHFKNGNEIKEFTVECGRPDSISEKKLMDMKKYGCDRISINPQTFCDNTLKIIGRNHSGVDIVNAYNVATNMGFNSINMDVILGLPNETVETAKDTVSKVISLEPENITVHGLSMKKGSYLSENKNIKLPDAETVEGMFEITYKLLYEAGYIPYYLYRQKSISANMENVGFSKPGFESYYNIAMMEETMPIISCGASGITKSVIKTKEGRTIKRHSSFKDVKLYIDNLDSILEEKFKLLDEMKIKLN